MRALAVGLLSFALVGCAAPTITASPTNTIGASPTPAVAPSPSPSAGLSFTCPPDVVVPRSDPLPLPPRGPGPYLPSSLCGAEEVAVQSAVAALGYPLQSILVVPQGFTCGVPFLSGPVACFQGNGGTAAYATFMGTDKVAALTLALAPSGPVVATLVTFAAPPAGWAPVVDTTVAVTVPLGGTHMVVVSITDHSGLLTGVQPAALPAGMVIPPSYGIQGIAAWNTTGRVTTDVWLYWGGAICDTTSQLVIGPGATTMTVTEGPRPACDASNDGRGLVLTFTKPIGAASIATTFVAAQPTP